MDEEIDRQGKWEDGGGGRRMGNSVIILATDIVRTASPTCFYVKSLELRMVLLPGKRQITRIAPCARRGCAESRGGRVKGAGREYVVCVD